jgi:hypothetical protein
MKHTPNHASTFEELYASRILAKPKTPSHADTIRARNNKIMIAISKTPMTVSQIAAMLDRTENEVSRFLLMLRNRDLAHPRNTGKQHGCKTWHLGSEMASRMQEVEGLILKAPMTSLELSEALGIDRRKLQAVTKQLKLAGTAHCDGMGLYAVWKHGPKQDADIAFKSRRAAA